MISSPFQSTFDSWLDQALADRVPREVVAFSFNLAQPWCIEVIGASRYSDDDPDWACEEVFRPDVKNLNLPKSEVGSDWNSVLESAKELISRYLNRPSAGSACLKKASAVAVGFVDGELHKVWPESRMGERDAAPNSHGFDILTSAARLLAVAVSELIVSGDPTGLL